MWQQNKLKPDENVPCLTPFGAYNNQIFHRKALRFLLGRRQAVRHRILIPASEGSSPSSSANS